MQLHVHATYAFKGAQGYRCLLVDPHCYYGRSHENKDAIPLPMVCAEQILEDVSEEHARKTITVDPFPHSGVPAASIHPCKHAAVMKKLGSMAEANGNPVQVDR